MGNEYEGAFKSAWNRQFRRSLRVAIPPGVEPVGVRREGEHMVIELQFDGMDSILEFASDLASKQDGEWVYSGETE